MNGVSGIEDIPVTEDLSKGRLRFLWVMLVGLVLFFYWPCLSGQSDWYVSDLTYFFEPFCKFIHDEVMMGRFPLWNPYLYCGMPQLAMPSPGLFYPISWVMFLLPFSAGLSLYMIIHQLIAAAGTYLYLRDLKYSRCAGMFGASAVTLCAYNFAFVRNCTLPASMAWLPIALYFERKIRSDKDSRRLWYVLGLAFCVAMMMHVGRPEVGAPELLLLGLASFSKPLNALLTRSGEQIEWKYPLFKMAAIGLGLALSLPTVVPGVEWTPLSPRAQGLALRWVLMWSANWYDFLSMVLSQPLGDLMALNDHTTRLRSMVLSRGGYLPFLSSTYLSPFPITLAIWGLCDKSNKMRPVAFVLLAGFVLMAAGVYTPFAPFVVKLSPIFAAFRYPVKLMFFPSMLLILLAVRGIDLIIMRRITMPMIKAVTIVWGLVLIVGLVFVIAPDICLTAGKWPWLFSVQVGDSLLKEAQALMAVSIIQAAFLGLSACACTFMVAANRLSGKNCAIALTVLMSAALIQSAVCYRSITAGGFYNRPSALANRLQFLRQEEKSGSIDTSHVHDEPAETAPIAMPTGKEVISNRFVNLYFDPLTVPPDYKEGQNLRFDEKFFSYTRDMLLYNTVQSWHLPCSYGYEAAETGDYKSCFTEAFSKCSQHRRDPSAKAEKISDAPVHRFAVLTATDFANTQIFKQDAAHPLPVLEEKYFQLVEESKRMNYRIYKVKHSRPRFYFTDKLVFIDKFKDLQETICSIEDTQATKALDESDEISYILNSDFEKHKTEFTQINSAIPLTAKDSGKSEASNSGNTTGSNDSTKGNCQLISDNGQETVLKVHTPSAKLLVIADHFYPGWIATLDGKEVEILKANIVNRAILIPAGAHDLKLSFKPKSLLIGNIGALVSFLLFLLCYWLYHRFQAPARSPAPDQLTVPGEVTKP